MNKYYVCREDHRMTYEEVVRKDLFHWKEKILKRSNVLERTTKKYQNAIYEKIPKKVNDILTSSVKGIVQSTIFGMEYIPKEQPKLGLSLAERDKLAKELLAKYKKIAAAEGAGTGFGGLFLGLVDFPALIAIKMKFLFELAHIYGYDTHNRKERLYLLYIFQLAFSSSEKRPKLLDTIEYWDELDIDISIDWEQFQREYRDSIDFRKMLQIIPGVGAVVGLWANYTLLEALGKVGINCYRMRILNE